MTIVNGHRTLYGRGTMGWLAGLTAALVWLVPAPAVAQVPIAKAVAYEVAEALKFKGTRTATDPEDFTRRIASATLLGKSVTPLVPGTPFDDAAFVAASASSRVSLATMTGPISGSFDLLADMDPTRNSLDTLVIVASGSLRGQLDLSTATEGYATMSGTYKLRGQPGARFEGIFLIPFPVPGLPGYWYLDAGPDAGTCVSPVAGLCPLGSDEYSLGIPLTKAVVVFFAGTRGSGRNED